MNFHTADGEDYYDDLLKDCAMKSKEEMFLWLDEHSSMIENEGNLLYISFRDQFKLSKDYARNVIHAWDAKRRNIPAEKQRKP